MQETAGHDTIPVFRSVITNLQPEHGILATAEVRIGGICTIRNVKENDYGIEVVMLRTKMPCHVGYKDLKAMRYGSSLTNPSFVCMNNRWIRIMRWAGNG